MTVAAEGRIGRALRVADVRDRIRRELPWIAPSLVAVLNAIAFVVVAPSVNDIWAAMARESAARHGVGLTYWFDWFGGGSTPGNYSVLTPSLSTLIGAGALGAVATAATTPLCWLAMRTATHRTAGVWVATLTAGLNLWSGRVPFALGSLTTVVAVLFVLARRQLLAAAAAVLTVLLSPVSGVFIALGLAGVFLTRPEYRRICWVTIGAVAASLIALALVFGQPGPESFSWAQLVQILATLLLFLFAASPGWVRATVWITVLTSLALFVIPTGLGDNLLRFGWYVLPAVVVATSGRRLLIALVCAALGIGFATKQSVGDVFEGTASSASPHYYDGLIHHLDGMQQQLLDYRLEVVQDGTHTAAYALLDHAMLARGYEYQDDNALNSPLSDDPLGATEYKVWLQDNAVGYVVIARTPRTSSPEYRLVSTKRPAYLHRVWHDKDWTLFRVGNANPIASAPVHVTARSQAQLTLSVPCACSFTVRVHYSRYLTAERTAKQPPDPAVPAKLSDDGFGWTTMTTTEPGRYRLSGSLTGGLLH